MDGGTDPIKHGDPLLFEWVERGSARDYTGERVLVEQSGPSGTAPALKVLEREGGSYRLVSANPSVAPLRGERNMSIVARLVGRLEQADVNPLVPHIGEVFKRQDVPPLYGLEYNPGNWQSGHVSIPPDVALFVTLTKDGTMAWGGEYVDHFEDVERFVWSSQTSTSADGKKGREILDALETGTSIHLWARQKKTRRRVHVLRACSADLARRIASDVRHLSAADAVDLRDMEPSAPANVVKSGL
jgi:hypothetical protein